MASASLVEFDLGASPHCSEDAAAIHARRLLVGAGLENQPVVHGPVGDLVLYLAVIRILAHVRDPSIRMRLSRVDDFPDEVLAVHVSYIEPVLSDNVG